MPDESWVMLTLFLGGGALTFSRRFYNKDKCAGEGIAAWTIVFVMMVLLKFLLPPILR